MVGGDRLAGAQRELSAKFPGGVVEIALMQIDQTSVVVSFGEFGIQLHGGIQFTERVGIVLALGVGLAEEIVDAGIGVVLLKQVLEDFRGVGGLARTDERSAPGEEERGIVGRIAQEGAQDFGGLGIIFLNEIAEAEDLSDK